MQYYVDFEFTKFEGEIISVGIVSETGKELYLALDDDVLEGENMLKHIDPWVMENVVPIIDVPGAEAERYHHRSDIKNKWPLRIYQYLLQTQNNVRMPATFITDWWEDVKLMSGLMITGPGTCINVPHGTFVVTRADTYPTTLEGAVQHNALWDARVLRHELGRFEERS